jgi:Family of unknown function (DUF6535)
VSIQDIKPNPQDTSAFYLANIYQLLADPNISRASILATPAQPPPFSPPKSAVLVNSLWFLSLVISLTSALLATMLQQWARRYLTITQPPRYSPRKRASIRAFFANGVEKFHLPWSVEALPALLHLSLFLFFTGLAIYLFNINHTVFTVVVWWVGLAGGVYGCITLMPIFWHDSPYYSPLSSSAWLFFNFTCSATLRIIGILFFLLGQGWPHFETYLPFHGLTKIVQDAGSKLSAEIIDCILTWTIDALEEDKELEQFIESIPGFCDSGAFRARDLQLDFTKFDKPLAWTLYDFIYRTLSSSLFLEEEKKRRVIICAMAADAARLSDTTLNILIVVFLYGDDLLRSADIWQSLRSTRGDQVPGLCSQSIIAGVVTRVSERDDRWRALARDQLGVSEAVFRNYLANGDSVLLSNLIHIIWSFFRYYLDLNEGTDLNAISLILEHISKFDIENTLPGLQHDFCDLWNEVIREARNRGSYHISVSFLIHIRHLYIALHQGTDAAPTAFDASTPIYSTVLYDPDSYPLCNIPSHRLISTTDESSHSLPTTGTSDPPDAFLNPSTEPSVSPFPALTEDDSRVRYVGESPLHDVLDTTSIMDSSRRSPHLNVETSLPAATSLGPISQGPTDAVPPASNTESYPHPTPAVSIPTLHPSFSPPSSNLPYSQNNADLGVVPDIALSSPSGPDTLPVGTQLTLASPASRIGLLAAVSRPQYDGTVGHDHRPRVQTSTLVGFPEQSHKSAMSAPDIAIDVSRLPLDTAPSGSSGDIDRPQ